LKLTEVVQLLVRQVNRARSIAVIILRMQKLRHLHNLARWVLACFVLSIGVAVATPLLNADYAGGICFASDVSSSAAERGDGDPSSSPLMGHCPLCIHGGAPPSVVIKLAAVEQPVYFSTRVSIDPVVFTTAAPLPARGPPTSL
jgi:Protein of unknown function (DUF2946)